MVANSSATTVPSARTAVVVSTPIIVVCQFLPRPRAYLLLLLLLLPRIFLPHAGRPLLTASPSTRALLCPPIVAVSPCQATNNNWPRCALRTSKKDKQKERLPATRENPPTHPPVPHETKALFVFVFRPSDNKNEPAKKIGTDRNRALYDRK